MLPEFQARNTRLVALSQEDVSVESFRTIRSRLKQLPEFPILVDANYKHTQYARTTGYLIDEEGIIQQIFPMETYARALPWAVLGEIDRLQEDQRR